MTAFIKADGPYRLVGPFHHWESDPELAPYVERFQAELQGHRAVRDALAKAALAVGDAVATDGEAPSKLMDALYDAACAFRNHHRSR